MKIFIGSSKKKKRMASHVANALDDAGFQAIRWWDPSVFQGGDITITRLIEMSDICDGAVFIFGADDDAVMRKYGKRVELVLPRDNVVLEYGLFVGKSGVKRTLFVTEPKVKIPTDLNGVTYLGKKGYAQKIVNCFKEVFRSAPNRRSTGGVTIHVHRKLINLLLEGGDPSWASRSLYLGSKGAKSWMAVEKDPNYSGTRDFTAVKKCIKKLASDNNLCSFDCIVSFGPGVGLLDKEVVPHLRGKQLVKYIPIDINYYLANYAAENVDAMSKQINVPFCILGDFEDGMSRIAETIHTHTAPGRAFMMLGGTFGNLEKGEDFFLRGLYDAMDEEDIFILDIFTADTGYTYAKDQLLPLNKQPKSVQRYLAAGVEKRRGLSIDTVVARIDKYIVAEQIPPNKASSIKNTYAFTFKCKQSNESIIYVRRYNYSSFKSYLEDFDFNVVASKPIHNDSSKVGRAIYFLRK